MSYEDVLFNNELTIMLPEQPSADPRDVDFALVSCQGSENLIGLATMAVDDFTKAAENDEELTVPLRNPEDEKMDEQLQENNTCLKVMGTVSMLPNFENTAAPAPEPLPSLEPPLEKPKPSNVSTVQIESTLSP